MAVPQVPDAHSDAAAFAGYVLHVAGADALIRFGRMFRHVALALNIEGLRVALLTDDRAAVADLEGTPTRCHWLRKLSGGLAWRLPGHLTEALDPAPSVVHLWGTACLRPVGNWASRHNTPLLVHALSAHDVEVLWRRGARRKLHVAAGCAALLELCRARSPALAEQWRLLPPAFLMPDLPVEAEAQTSEHTLGVLWAGRFIREAGLDTLLEAVAQLRRQACDLHLVLLGTGPDVAAVRARIRQARLQDCTSLIDEPRLWDKAMHGADVCVVPARQSELSLAPLLAMAQGKVVLASRDQLAEWFIEDQTTWQFSPGSAVELAYQLGRVAAHDRQAQQLGQSAAAYVRAHHALSGLVTSLLAVYADLAGTRIAPASVSVRVVEGGRP